MKAVNWNRPDDEFTAAFWNQNVMQFWTDEEIPLSDDKMSWMTLRPEEQQTYMQVLGGLTLLDTLQGGIGMPQILEHVDGLQRKAVLSFMGRHIHAKSYSSIFTGKMTSSGEIIDLILRDESIHGLYVGVLAQEVFAELPPKEQAEAQETFDGLLTLLHENEMGYTEELYTAIGLTDEVKRFVRYNANKALMNLGLEPRFPEEEVNPIVLNGISTHTKQHDFFSKKGNGYIRTIHIEPLRDEDFIF